MEVVHSRWFEAASNSSTDNDEDWVQKEAPNMAGIFSCLVPHGKGSTSYGPRVCSPFGVRQLLWDVVPGAYLCLCFDDIMFVTEGAVQDNLKLHWLGIVSQSSPISASIQLSVCIPVPKMKNTICVFSGFVRRWLTT